ncbi:MAG: SgcJ/EcaC family oxidoreductase [Acidobacteriia bacterium]|nr:SgcJ/EcaC family oxidoreductase [Terriglobia bacterium]
MYRPFSSGAHSQSLFIDVESTIRGLTQDYSTAFNTGNYEQVAELFTSDGLFMPPHREAAQGPKAIEQVLRDHGEKGYQDLRLETTRVDNTGDMAIEIGRYTVAVRQGNGTTLADRGKFIHAWRRLGVWMMVAACWNSDLPPAS